MLGNGWYNMTTRTVWHFRESRLAGSSQTALLASRRIHRRDFREDIVSDTSWKAATSPVLADSLYNGEVYDAREEKDGWTGASYNDSSWAHAEVMAALKGTLTAQMIAPIKIEETSVGDPHPGAPVREFTSSISAETISGHAPTAGEGRARPAGGVVVVYRRKRSWRMTRWTVISTALTWGGSFQSDSWLPSKARWLEEWEPRFAYHGFRYVEVRGFPASLSWMR